MVTCPDCGMRLQQQNLAMHQQRRHLLDEVAIERAMAGDRAEWLTRRERAEAARRLTTLGYTAQDISERLGITPRTVYRIRARQNTNQHQESA